ncbi:MAG TPA: cell division protein ZapA [Candidatus Atopostipes pullistercoris]|uniref:Cell division protein ZapA n=1 Tax=Candidatus Atopostipes pullistercoris TaxID=2838467 RepID=A0A9D2G3L0_9LACT|nr:cell division protein ZapA [Candidatus Atopostipes pullistercoris]
MTTEKRRVKVTIDEKDYTIISNKSATHIKLVAETINKQLKELNELSSNLSKEEQAILIAVNAISDQIDYQHQMIQLEEKLNKLNKNEKRS